MKFKQCWRLAVGCLAVSALTRTAPAQVNTNPVPNLVISWCIDQYGFDNAVGGSGVPVPNTSAGLALATNWNDGWSENYSAAPEENPVTVKNLFDLTGAATTLNIAYNCWSPYPMISQHLGQDADGSYNREMLDGYLNNGLAAWNSSFTNSSVVITTIPYANYDVVVYLATDTSGRNASISDGATTNYLTTLGAAAEVGNADDLALFLPTTQTNSSEFPSADFAFFPAQTNGSITLTCEPKSGLDQWLGISGFQVIQSSNVYVLYGPTPPAPIISVGRPAGFSVLAGGLHPQYQWRHAGTNILNATNATYAIASTRTGQDGSYSVVVTNSFSSVTSAVATLTFYAPKTVEWVGGLSSTWDTSTFNWTVNGGVTTTNYADTDNARFDLLGAAQSTVSLSGNVTPTSLTVSNASYIITSGGLVGSGSLHVTRNGTLILDTLDTCTGPTLIDSGSTLQVDNGDNVGGLSSGALTNNGTLLFNSGGDYGYGFPIYGTGIITNESSSGTVTLGSSVNASDLVQVGGGTLLLQGANNLTGGLVVDAGIVTARVSTSLGGGTAQLNGGDLQLTYGNDFAGTAMTLAGGTLYGGQFGNNSYDGTVSLTADSDIEVGASDTFTLNSAAGLNAHTNNFSVNSSGGSGTLILAGTNNTWKSLAVYGGTLQIGTGGTGTFGAGTISGSGSITFDLAGNLTVTNPITLTGNISQNGAGILNLAGDLTQYYGETMVAAGELDGTNTYNGEVSILAGGTLAVGTPLQIGTLTIDNNLTLGGNLVVKVNKSLAPSNDLVTVTGSLSNTNNGIVTVINPGPALKVGDTFTLFSQPVSGGNTLFVSGGGVVWTNNLAVNGAISVVSTTVPRPFITGVTPSFAAGTIVFSGTNGIVGGPYYVLSSTNLTQTNWTLSASGIFDGSGNFVVTNVVTAGTPQMFYRLQVP
jgi:autotransporter-associated beta strand protein